MAFFDKLKSVFNFNRQNLNDTSVKLDDVLLRALLYGEELTKEKVMTLPSVNSSVDLISSMIASTPIKLYRYNKGKIEVVKNDSRVKLLNGDTGDTVDGFHLKQNLVEDYLLDKGGYAYIRRDRNTIKSLHYVEPINVYILKNTNPIFKYVQIGVNGKTYYNFNFIKLLRKTRDGGSGVSLINELSKTLETAYQTLIYELSLVKSGGNKKGFLLSDKKLSQEAINELKAAWNKLYRNNENNVAVLNNGIKFQESSNSSVEMQLNEKKKTLNDEIYDIFHVNKNSFEETFKLAIYPIIKAFESAINSTMLLESEKKNFYFGFDVKELIRANVKDRAEALKIYKDIGLMTINEMRESEDMNYIEGLDVIPLTLGNVLYDVQTGTYYTPNTGEVRSSDNTENNTKGGDVIEE